MLTWFHQPPKTKFKILPFFLNKEECGPFTFLKTIFYKHTNLHCLSIHLVFPSQVPICFFQAIIGNHVLYNVSSLHGKSMGKQWKQWQIFFWGGCCKITADGDWSHEIKRHLLLGRKVMTNLDSILKSRDITLPQRSVSSLLWFFHSHVWMWRLDYKESWALKNWCFWTVVLEKIPESPLDCKEIQPVHPKGNQSWIFIRRTDAAAETPIL